MNFEINFFIEIKTIKMNLKQKLIDTKKFII